MSARAWQRRKAPKKPFRARYVLVEPGLWRRLKRVERKRLRDAERFRRRRARRAVRVSGEEQQQ